LTVVEGDAAGLQLSVLGKNQVENAGVAVKAVRKLLGEDLDEERLLSSEVIHSFEF
jgi:hypothetical protein